MEVAVGSAGGAWAARPGRLAWFPPAASRTDGVWPERRSAPTWLVASKPRPKGAIAEKAGVTRGTVHRHFPTREALMDAVRRQARDDADSDEEDYLRPPGELAYVSSTPLSVATCSTRSPRTNSESRSSPKLNDCPESPPPPCMSSTSTAPACSASPAPRHFPLRSPPPRRSARHSRLDVGDREFLLERWDNA